MASTTSPGSNTMLAGTTALGTVSGAQIIEWAFDCLAAGHLIKPDMATAQLMAGILAPVIHGLWRAWTTRLETRAGADLDGDGAVGVPIKEAGK